MIRKILAPLTGQPSDQTTLGLAFMAARLFDAHVDAVFIALDPREVIPIMGEAVPPDMMERLIQQRWEAMAAASREADLFFNRARSAADAPLVEHPAAEGPEAGTPQASAWFHVKTGRIDRVLTQVARCADLIVVPQGSHAALGPLATARDAVLFDAGRPLLLAPPVSPQRFGQSVAVAWNDSAESARAVTAAMPFLAKAGRVFILVREDPRRQVDGAADLVAHLAWHGVDAAIDRLPRIAEEPVGHVLTQRALDLGSSLLVMGAYGHSRFREMMLGGATRQVLENASRIPVLMAH
ncbi:universal stress protein UspA [Skermanella stibiiresistens SB22]|uniref:Universal stress protein UspA n=1 Tax=Skermanella stibiiresistens SB22 TaxID=1385369 RepID=W9HCJ9_9PROT|nr:universal stress protein [Skermanella stibiiresistens]EWY42461.1 universal stress protein UspA [Skermanella stibiiresistens SB22]